MGEILLIPAIQVSDPGAGAGSCAYCPTVSGQPADPAFCVKRYQVGNQKGTEELILICFERMGVFDHRKRCGHPLVAAPGADHHRHVAAVHPRIRTCRRPGSRSRADIIAHLQQNLADVRSIIMAQPFVGNSGIQLDLAREDGLDIFQAAGTGKVIDILHGQKRIIRSVLILLISRYSFFKKNRSILFDMYNVGMLVGDTHTRMGISGRNRDDPGIGIEVLDQDGVDDLVVAVCAWLWGQFCGLNAPVIRRRVAGAVGLALLIGACVWAVRPADPKPQWKPLTAEYLAENLGKKLILIEFTADWCPNCKFMEATVLKGERMHALKERYGVELVRADLTETDAWAMRLLEALGSRSIPLTAVFPKGEGASSPFVLRDVYGAGMLEQALGKAAGL